MAVYSLGERKVAFRGEEWFIADNATVIGTVVLHADPGIPLTLGRNVSVGHQAMLHGCTIGDGTLVGIGAIIMNHAVIGSGCLIGAGSVIPEGKTYPDGVLVVGSPGKIVRELKQEEKDGLLENADIYVRRSKLYREKLKPQER